MTGGAPPDGRRRDTVHLGAPGGSREYVHVAGCAGCAWCPWCDTFDCLCPCGVPTSHGSIPPPRE